MSWLNQKIRLIENVMAEQAVESELMKKYYLGLTANKKQGKVGDFHHFKHRVGQMHFNSKDNKK
ncbi:MAG: hypothetical protein KDD45_11100 [Bdellovibrionales bacterium]|nr:hypothetical protein [Bdellovibrionales bacterium]